MLERRGWETWPGAACELWLGEPGWSAELVWLVPLGWPAAGNGLAGWLTAVAWPGMAA